MKLHSIYSSPIWGGILLTCSLGMLGCAQGGPGIATGECAVGIGGPATITVSPELRLSLGDSAIEAASRAMGNYLAKILGPINTTEMKKAVTVAMDAGEQAKGTPLTVIERSELENRAQATIHDYKTRCGKS